MKEDEDLSRRRTLGDATDSPTAGAERGDPTRVVAGGYMDRSIADFQRACASYIVEEQEKQYSDNALIALLCDAVRCSRELSACATKADAAPWRPIETAPQDGRTILVFKYTPPGWSIVGMAFWFGGDSGIQGWMSYGIPQLNAEPNTLGLAHPTHWMPLPDPPGPAPAVRLSVGAPIVPRREKS